MIASPEGSRSTHSSASFLSPSTKQKSGSFSERGGDHAISIKDEKEVKGAGQDHLARKLSPRQIQMIAIGGTIGTGLFLGTGKSLATGGPASMLIAYCIVGFIVYQTMLCLGEMSTYMPIAGSFTTYASRFVDEGLGFALTWNYWMNDAVSVAGDLTAMQMLLQWWGDFLTWPFAVGLLLLLIGLNLMGVKMYGYIEYSLSILKVITIILVIVVGLIVNLGGNYDKEYIGFKNWKLPGAPFVGGFGGFLSVFVTAAFSFGGTESIGVTAGETRNPRRNMPKVIRNVFWRVLLFYILGTFIIGLDVPYSYPGLSTKDSGTSPFTLIFNLAGFKTAAHIMNAVILTSVISAGNHALFAGSRLLYALGREGHAPAILGRLDRRQAPALAVLMTSLVSCICFASSYVGHGQLWTWLQSMVGVSNQISWICIGITSWRFRRALVAQGVDTETLPFQNPYYRWGPVFVFFANIILVLLQGWKSVLPSQNDGHFYPLDFLSYYIEIPLLFGMWGIFKLVKRSKIVPLVEMDLNTDRYEDTPEDELENIAEDNLSRKRKIFRQIF